MSGKKNESSKFLKDSARVKMKTNWFNLTSEWFKMHQGTWCKLQCVCRMWLSSPAVKPKLKEQEEAWAVGWEGEKTDIEIMNYHLQQQWTHIDAVISSSHKIHNLFGKLGLQRWELKISLKNAHYILADPDLKLQLVSFKSSAIITTERISGVSASGHEERLKKEWKQKEGMVIWRCSKTLWKTGWGDEIKSGWKKTKQKW